MSVICTTPQCDKGEASVAQMDAVFKDLSADLQNHFQSAHDAIMTALNSYWTSLDSYVPFNPACCSILSLGVQADQLTQQMQSAAGQQVTTGPSLQDQQSGCGILDLLGTPGQIGGIALIVLVGALVYFSKK
jgi:hypothetical protein